MRITEGRLRRIIREELLTEAAYTPEIAASEGLRFVVRQTRWGKGGWNVMCLSDSPDARDPVMGEISFNVPLGMGKCRGAYEVTKSIVGINGLGPLLYDIAMEVAGPAGIMPDRRMVSPEARRVWNYYLDSRPDVTHDQLDSKPGTITPDIEEDDCLQDAAGEVVINPEKGRYASLRRGGDWVKSPLSKVYRKRGTPTIDRLRALGIIDIVT